MSWSSRQGCWSWPGCSAFRGSPRGVGGPPPSPPSGVAAEVGALVAIAAYVLAVGPQPSVIRAGVGGALASLAWLSGRQRDRWYALLVAAVVLLAWNPYNALDPGFQLSFAAVLSIFVLAPRFQ